MNALEKVIIRSAINAQETYMDMSDGEWLSHGPELFLQCEIARAIWKNGFWVGIDSSTKKTRGYLQEQRGARALNSRKRFDIVVWHKSGRAPSLRAAMEIKRAYTIGPVRADADKLKKHLQQRGSAKTAYLLVYSEALGNRGLKTLEGRFNRWARDLAWTMVNYATEDPDNSEWVWGVCLLKRAKPRT